MDLKCGYLFYRNPSKETWYTVRPWARKWVEIRENRTSEGRSVLLEAYEDQNEFDKPVLCVLLKNVTLIRRTLERKQRYGLEIYSGDKPLLYLAGDNEGVIHEWIGVLKRALLPKINTVRKLPDVGSEFYRVWALPMATANRLRLNGEFLLAVTQQNFELYNENGTLCLKWHMKTLKRFVILNDSKSVAPADCGKILYVETGRGCQDGEGEFYFYSNQAKSILETIMSKINDAVEKLNIPQARKREGDERDDNCNERNPKENETEKQGQLDNRDAESVDTGISSASESSRISEVGIELQTDKTVTTKTDIDGDMSEKASTSVSGKVSVSDSPPCRPIELSNNTEKVSQLSETTDVTRKPNSGLDESGDNITSPHSSPLGTLGSCSPRSLRRASNSSSGYWSDAPESRYKEIANNEISDDSGHYQNINSQFYNHNSLTNEGRSQSVSFSLYSGADRITEPRRHSESGGHVYDWPIINYDTKQQRTVRLSKYLPHQEFRNSDILTDVATSDPEFSKIPAPFDLIDVHSLSGRIKLPVNKFCDVNKQTTALPDIPPEVPKRSTSLPKIRSSRRGDKKSKKSNRLSRFISSLAVKMSSPPSIKSSSKRYSYSQQMVTSSPTLSTGGSNNITYQVRRGKSCDDLDDYQSLRKPAENKLTTMNKTSLSTFRSSSTDLHSTRVYDALVGVRRLPEQTLVAVHTQRISYASINAEKPDIINVTQVRKDNDLVHPSTNVGKGIETLIDANNTEYGDDYVNMEDSVDYEHMNNCAIYINS
ncbi:uncharacterized protein LOC100376319 [Saccoglossus kowalevskii]|uniref:Uncharacterized protein LOC100376319 n=1 Tax=Saccoglossus kowalevskii TaxID=10224 RepID=A0ABM0GQ54_SACKO|nr:PREDICTED: uncharacterized protein LOC100376319 [Saccoglossus kowalevskii]